MRSWLSFIVCGAAFALTPAASRADGIPLDDAGFTSYIQQKLQLYSPAPVRVTGPFAVAIGPETGANLVYTFKPLHDDCIAAPAQCPQKTHDYVQDIVRRFPSANSGPPPADILPSDKPAFMERLAAELGRLLPGDTVEADGMTLNVTRPGGHAIAFDQRGYYKLCADASFNCRVPMLQSLARTAAWLAAPEPARLKSSLHIMASCTVIASVGNSVSCTVRPSPEPMAPIFRHAFANLEEVCFKAADGGIVPLTNADRRDLDLSIGAALDLCGKSTRDVLGALHLPPPAADGIGTLAEPYATSRALFPADWTGLAQDAGDHLLIAVPSRDTLLYMKGDGPAEIAALGARAQAAFAGPLAISSDVYRWNGDGWSLATAGSTMTGGPIVPTDLMPHVH